MQTTNIQRIYKNAVLALSMIIALLLLVGCGGSVPGTTGNGTPREVPTTASTPTTATGSTGTVAPSNVDPCSLVTTQQVSQILGATVQSQQQTVSIGTTQAPSCHYTSTQQGAIASLGLLVNQDTTTAQSAFSQLKQAVQATAGSQFQTINGVGSDAFTDGNVLYVLKDNVLLVTAAAVAGHSTDKSMSLRAEQQLAQAAVQRL